MKSPNLMEMDQKLRVERNDLIDLLRFFGAAGIVYFHQGAQESWIGHSALLVFIIVSTFMATSGSTPAWRRTRVLYIWAFWSVIYVGLKILQSVSEGRAIASEFDWWMLATGPVLPLWFLPFIYVSNSLVHGYLQKVVIKPNQFENFVLVFLLILSLGLSTLNFKVPFAQWLLGIGGVLAALSIVRGKEMPSYVFSVLAALIVMQLIAPLPAVKMFILAVSVCAAVLLWIPAWTNSLARRLGGLSLGIYVLHHGVSVVLEEISLDLPLFGMPFWVIFGSSMIALAFKSIPLIRKFV